ncbi:MAG: major facilitator superfamily 1 [Flaviaesturariibacter sp.]|nr:major facilitator superfamily 1 [Flaviaesturariibacter sp.]
MLRNPIVGFAARENCRTFAILEERKAPDPTAPVVTSQLKRTRLSVALFYFGQGIAFASWASRIPDIKRSLHLNDAVLGSVLLALPLGQLCTMPVSGRLVTRFGSKRILTIAAPLYVLAMSNLGLATKPWQLAVFLFFFGVAGNLCNISVNTQGVEAEKLYPHPIMTSFHGAWSLAGFVGALIGFVMIRFGVPPYPHFVVIVLLLWTNVLLNHKWLVPGVSLRAEKKRGFRPDSALMKLGLVGFCSMATEGAMFDWSGVYFRDIVGAPNELVVVGYASFMIMMATGRFLGDRVIARVGRTQTVRVSGLVISSGMAIAVLFPYLATATLGFMLVGVGVSSVVPTLYGVAGRHERIPPGIALATVSSVSYLGFLMGPPLIGYISALSSLRYSYAVIGCFGILITALAARVVK